jgi:paraquat-inducible protein A
VSLSCSSVPIRCHECGLDVAVDELSEGQEASCPKCGRVISRAHHNALLRMAVFTTTSFLALLFANTFVFLRLDASGQQRSLTLPQSTITLFEQGDWVLGVITLIVIVLLPLAIAISLGLLLLTVYSQQSPPRATLLLKLIGGFKFWNMAEIYFLGVLVSIIKIISLADIHFGPSFWFFALFTLSQITALLHFDRFQIEKRLGTANSQRAKPTHARNPESWSRSAAYLLTGLLLYIPANALPIMTVTSLGTSEENTIVGGVITLWAHGSYPIALVIFIASVFVPLSKFLVLIWLLACQRLRLLSNPESKILAWRATEFIGRWSMVDVFVVAFLAGLVQFGSLMSIASGPAVLAFAGMVIATMLAAASVDPQAFWEHNERAG